MEYSESTHGEAKRYLTRVADLRSRASSWRGHWRDLARFLSPRRVQFDTSDRYSAGTKKNDAIINNTGSRAKNVLASGMMAGITSPARPWFRLRVGDFGANKAKAVKLWLGQVERILLETFARTNVYNSLAMVYDDLATFAVSQLFIEEHDEDIMRCYVPPVGSYYYATDSSGKICTMYRETDFTAEQLVEKFGWENVSGATRTLMERHMPDTRRDVLQVIERNDMQLPWMADASGMKYRSVWLETGRSQGDKGECFGANHQVVLGKGGYNEWPCPAPRWSVRLGDVYGYGPGMDALGDIRALQHMERRRAQGLDKMITPTMNAPASLRKRRAALASGSVNYLDMAGQGAKLEPAFMVDPRAVFLENELARHERRIEATFHVDLFMMLANSGLRQPISAREVEERHEEKMLQLGPVLERLQDELLDPLIDRAFGILQRRGMIPPAPLELEGQDARPEYISILAQAQKMLGVVSVERLTQYVLTVSEAQPDVLDKMNFDRAVDEVSEMMGSHPDLVRTDDEVADRRQSRAEEQQAQVDQSAAMKNMASAAQSAASTAQTIDQSPTAQAIAQQVAGPLAGAL